MFDPESFMNQTLDQPLETERKLVPPGEYRMRVGDFDSNAFETFDFTYKKGPKAGEAGSMHKFTCPVVIDDDRVRQAMSTDEPKVYVQCTLDVDETGQLQWGPNRNVDLGKLRHAVGQNVAGQPWSIANLRGAGPFMGKVEHREGKRKDGSPFKVAEVTRFAPIR
jgi:hypothetical protein